MQLLDLESLGFSKGWVIPIHAISSIRFRKGYRVGKDARFCKIKRGNLLLKYDKPIVKFRTDKPWTWWNSPSILIYIKGEKHPYELLCKSNDQGKRILGELQKQLEDTCL